MHITFEKIKYDTVYAYICSFLELNKNVWRTIIKKKLAKEKKRNGKKNE